MGRWHRFWQLAPAERWVLVQALVLLPLSAVALKLTSCGRWQAALAGLGRRVVPPAAAQPESLARQARATARVVQAAANHGLYRGTCLEQSFTLWWLLRRQGIASDLRIGVRKDSSSRLDAHAWVEHLGVALNDAEDVSQRYASLERTAADPTPIEQR